MAQIDSMLISIEEYTTNANLVKELVISRLVTDKVITEEQSKDYIENWQVVIIKPTWFERWAGKFKITNPSNYRFKYLNFEN
jgi:hypothetical protein